MNPEAYGQGNDPHHHEDVADEIFGDDYSMTDIYPSEIDELNNEAENIPDNERVESIPTETATEERLGDFDERLRLLNIERDIAARDIENWQLSPDTNPADFQYKLPYMKVRLNTAEHAISSSALDRDLVSAQVENPEATDEVVRTFIRNQVLAGKTKPHRDNIHRIDTEESTLQDKLARYEKTIDSSQRILDGEDADTYMGEGELSKGQRRDLFEKIHQTSEMYEAVLSQKMSGNFGDKRTELETQIKALEELGIADEELPKIAQDDPDFAACLHEANFSYSEEDALHRQRTGYDPTKEALAIFSQRFPHKAEFYKRLEQSGTEVVAPEEIEFVGEENSAAGIVPEESSETIIHYRETEPVSLPATETVVSTEDFDESQNEEAIPIKMEESERELLKHITGLEANDPKVYERLVEDKAVIRSKYDLPPLEMRSANPAEYEQILRARMEKEGIEYKEAWEVGGFFEHNESAAGVFLNRDNAISSMVDRSDLNEYYSSLGTMEHELIHGLQHKYSSNMPIELAEYEAYIGSNFNVERLKESDDPEEGLSFMFGSFGGIKGSVDFWYKTESEHRGETLVPEWHSGWKAKQEKIKKKREALLTENNPDTFDEKALGEKLNYAYRKEGLEDSYKQFLRERKQAGAPLTSRDLSEFDAYLKKINPLLADDFMEFLMESDSHIDENGRENNQQV